MEIGEYIKQQRRARDWSLSDLEQVAGLSNGFLSDVENGKSDPSLNSLQLIAKAFDCGAGDLLVAAGYTVTPISVRHVTVTFRIDAAGNVTVAE